MVVNMTTILEEFVKYIRDEHINDGSERAIEKLCQIAKEAGIVDIKKSRWRIPQDGTSRYAVLYPTLD